jgi:DNA segregation ATPase FtsK/SpoIIIE, S-DNA-T family
VTDLNSAPASRGQVMRTHAPSGILTWQVLNAVTRVEAIFRSNNETLGEMRDKADAAIRDVQIAFDAERRRTTPDIRPKELRDRLARVRAPELRLDYERDLQQGRPRPLTGSLEKAGAQYLALLQETEQNVRSALGRLRDWNKAGALGRFASGRPGPLPPRLADDVVTLGAWAFELCGMLQGELDRREAEAESEIRGKMNALRDAAVASMRAELPRLLDEVRRPLEQVVGAGDITSRAWTDPLWAAPPPPAQAGADVRLGQFAIQAPAEIGAWDVPATLRFPFDAGLFINGDGAARAPAVDLARSVCVRLLAAVPPGRLRFTFIDPVSLGQSVADFQHLGDFDKQLIGIKPATTPRDIEARIAGLSGHVEMVISEYLRGQFQSIREYNAVAGELAEPYRVLVVFDYPAGFTEQSAHQLLSLAENGPRCGVNMIVVTDSAREQPRDLPADRLRMNQHRVDWAGAPAGSLARLDLIVPAGRAAHEFLPDTAPPVVFDSAGSPLSPAASLMAQVGERAREVSDEAVNLRRLLPALNQLMATGRSGSLPRMSAVEPITETDASTWWRGSTGRNAIAPLGLSGAQDVASMFFSSTDIAGGAIMVGLPRSGKTTALHSAILTMCMLYGPDELELYLIDAKHGVEFKVYERLPHARMVSVHSEREFSVAVLKSLDLEIARRAELMKTRAAGRANITEYREATGEPMPRIVLIMDEFHEIFEEDDRLGHDAFQAFSNIVRQGPFAGVHVVVASQTLSSMPALDRPTLQLLPQRVAFMCNESDSDIVMGDMNRGAQLLSRQGRGLFNPARGEVSQNKFFQGLFVAPQERDAVIQALRAKAEGAGFQRLPRVFDGDSAAPFPDVLAPESSPTRVRIPVGEPFSLDPCVSVTLRRTRGANILILGDVDSDSPRDWAVRGALHSCISAAAAGGAEIRVIDFFGDEMVAGLTVMDVARRAGAGYARSRGASEVVHQAAATVEKRLAESDYSGRTQVLVLFGLQRALSLQAADPYASYDDGAAADSDVSLLGMILRDGPEVGVHVVTACDSAKTVERRLGAELVSEFAFRVAGSAATAADLSLTTGTYGDPPKVRGNQLLVGDQLSGTVSRVRGYPLITGADASRFQGVD